VLPDNMEEEWYVQNGMCRMVCAEWYVQNGMCSIAFVEWHERNGKNGIAEMEAEGWECLVYRIVHAPQPRE